MKFYRALLAFGLMPLLAAGCNTMSGQPELRNAQITPPALHPGATALITLEVKDKHRIIERVEGQLKEDDRITLKLYDDGTHGDVEAGDSIWSLQVDVPDEAPPGEFAVDFVAYRSDGQPVPIRDDQGNVTILTESLAGAVQPLEAAGAATTEETPLPSGPSDEAAEGNRGVIR
ncbi:MAG: hypothetical protein IT368_13720 [Candidatus Hydrogenedentes bacterium]|nr:hypothetical protein [Candidatus Hydrogenedentota bacterium]